MRFELGKRQRKYFRDIKIKDHWYDSYNNVWIKNPLWYNQDYPEQKELYNAIYPKGLCTNFNIWLEYNKPKKRKNTLKNKYISYKTALRILKQWNLPKGCEIELTPIFKGDCFIIITI